MKVELVRFVPAPHEPWNEMPKGSHAIMSYDGTEFKVGFAVGWGPCKKYVQIDKQVVYSDEPEWTPIMEEAYEIYRQAEMDYNKQKAIKLREEKQKQEEALRAEKRKVSALLS